jgi:hypothetical protein
VTFSWYYPIKKFKNYAFAFVASGKTTIKIHKYQNRYYLVIKYVQTDGTGHGFVE